MSEKNAKRGYEPEDDKYFSQEAILTLKKASRHVRYLINEGYDLKVPFTKESWHGRMRACRGVGASLTEEELVKWDREHRELLNRIAPEQFDVLHYAALAVLKKK